MDRWMGLMPDYYRDIREFEELMKTLGEEARLLEIEKERLLNNQFVLSSDEGAIKRRETELGIQSDPKQESLDFRKKRIINRYSTKPPFTIRYLQERLDYLIGRGRANASVDPQDFVLKVRTKINDASVFREVEHTVHSIKPANLVYHQETSLAGRDRDRRAYLYDSHPPLDQAGFLEGWTDPICGEREGGTSKMIISSFIQEVADYARDKIATVYLNSSYQVEQVQKTFTGNTVNLEYIVPKGAMDNISLIELKTSDDQLISRNEVFIPITSDTVIKQTLFVEEV
ncbi:DUF2313 domain-containing protein [Paenibacillus larvae]|nr:putative phage tail protein [Paenibacillus larvae]MDT2303114.1 DUF2313 domain-containing protein [Paenibacillus larvae]